MVFQTFKDPGLRHYNRSFNVIYVIIINIAISLVTFDVLIQVQ